MGLCNKLNCCNSGGTKDQTKGDAPVDKNNLDNADQSVDTLEVPNDAGNDSKINQTTEVGKDNENGEPRTANGGSGNEPLYAQVQKRKSKAVEVLPPKRADFLVSFVVDSRGGAMTGCRGSGLRVILPAGAVEQPIRVTCRFIRPQSHNLPYPPPIMERDALASGIIEVGPAGYKFKLPVLVEIPYFASLGQGERELIVLRSEDGEIWKEHELNTDFSGKDAWKGKEGELYMDVVKSTDLNKAADALDTGRIVRLSTNTFPKYFAVLARIKGEVKTIGPEGGQVSAKAPRGDITVSFPKNSLMKKIKIALQLQSVPSSAIKIMDSDEGVIDVYPLIGIYPRRRKFHNPIEISIPVISEGRSNEVKKVWILCSLSSASERAVWEDVSDAAAVEVRGKKLVFQTKVTALFWLITCSKEYKSDRMLHMASCIYKELTVSPYIARLTVYHRPSFPFAWCDTLRIYLAVNDRMESYIEQKDDNWKKVLDGKELEVNDRCIYRFDVVSGDMMLASECQIEAKLDDRLVFKAFQECSLTLLVKSTIEQQTIKHGTLLMKQQSNIPGASRKDSYHHSTWVLDFGEEPDEQESKLPTGNPYGEYETIEISHAASQDKEIPTAPPIQEDIVMEVEAEKEMISSSVTTSNPFEEHHEIIIKTMDQNEGVITTKDAKVIFPSGALTKSANIAVQIKPISSSALKVKETLDGVLDVYPIIGIYPRRRKFHKPIEVRMPLLSDYKETKKVWVLCSLSRENEDTIWEDITNVAGLEVEENELVLKTWVSALFWFISCSKDCESSQIKDMALEIHNQLQSSHASEESHVPTAPPEMAEIFSAEMADDGLPTYEEVMLQIQHDLKVEDDGVGEAISKIPAVPDVDLSYK